MQFHRTNSTKFSLFQVLLVRIFVAAVISHFAVAFAFSQKDDKANANLIRFGDTIEVDVVGSLEFDWRGTLTPEGNLDGFDFFDAPIRAHCRNTTEVGTDIVKNLSKLLRSPQVQVTIIESFNRADAILDGAVKNPHRFKIMREVRLRELLIRAGGITENASGEVRIFRPDSLQCASSDTVRTNSIRLVALKDLFSGDASSDPIIESGDIVTVLESDSVFVIGGVAVPKKLYYREKLSLEAAINSCGGFTKNANRTAILIFRRSAGSVERVEITPQTDKNTVNLSPNDVIVVGDGSRDSGKSAPIVQDMSQKNQGFGIFRLAIIE